MDIDIKFYTESSGLPKSEQADFAGWLTAYSEENALNQAFESHPEIWDSKEFTVDCSKLRAVKSHGDNAVEPGQVRLLKKEAITDTEVPTSILILSQWEDDYWLVAAFSRFPIPATPGELMLNEETSTRENVLQCWNAQTLPTAVLRKNSYPMGKISEDSRLKACQLYFHLLADDPLPENMEFKTGPKILSAIDPRIQYMQAEKWQIAPLKKIATKYEQLKHSSLLRFVFAPQTRDNSLASGQVAAATEGILPFNAACDSHELRLAAGEEKKGIEKHFLAISSNSRVTIRYNEKEISLLVMSSDGNDSEELDGATVRDEEGKVLAEIKDGYVTFPSTGFNGTLLLTDVDGWPIELKEMQSDK